MLLKCCQTEKKTKVTGNTQKRSTVSNMRPTSMSQTIPRMQRKAVRSIAVKRNIRAVKEEPTVDPLCDNSNDSGLGFEQHQEYNVALRFVEWPGDRLGLSQEQSWVNESPEVKRKRLEIKIESDDANDNFTFPDSVRQRSQHLLSSPPYPVIEPMTAPSGPRPTKRHTQSSVTTPHVFSIHKDNKPPRSRVLGPNVLTNQLLGLNKSRGKTVPSLVANQMTAVSRDGKTQLIIICQPEQQHRARYQTEGSRGAVKDRTGNGFPQVQLSGWVGPATLEVYIGSDCGKLVPHMFYQACRVSGKNSTQCQERTEEGTVIIEIPFEPTKDMTVTCDCVGILKERNVDVEHRFPDQSGPRNKKKSTRCRMVFRTFLTHPDGSQEMLQICSQPIACTQPPGIPEICKKSLTSSPAGGGLELFILGKNFLKDTRVLFSNSDLQPPWEVSVSPDKEYLQQSHLVCVVPPYQSVNISEPVTVRLTVTSSDKSSEAHCFTYTPQSSVVTGEVESHSTKIVHPEVNPAAAVSEGTVHSSHVDTSSHVGSTLAVPLKSASQKSPPVDCAESLFPPHSLQYVRVEPKQGSEKDSIFPLVLWKTAGSDETKLMSAKDLKVFSLPAVRKNLQLVKPPALVPLLSRRPTSEIKTEEGERKLSPDQGILSTEMKGIDLSVKSTAGNGAHLVTPSLGVSMATGADLGNAQSPSMATLRRFVANDNGLQLPSLNVENFLSHLERKSENSKKGLKDFCPQVDSKLVNMNTLMSQPEYVPLETLTATHAPLGSQAQILPNFQQLSEEKIASASMESSIGAKRKPCTKNPVSALHYRSQVTSTSIEQNENLTVMPGANLLQNVSHEQKHFLSQPPESSEVQERNSISNQFLSQDVTNSSTITCTSASNTASRQAAHHIVSDVVLLQSHLDTSVGNISGLKQSSDLSILPSYEKDHEPTSILQANDNTNLGHKMAFTTYVVEHGHDQSLHSPPLKCKDSLLPVPDSTFKNHKDEVNSETPNECNSLLLNSHNSVSVNNFIAESGSICSPPVQLTDITDPAQALSDLGNNHNSLKLPSPTIHKDTRTVGSQGSPPLGNSYMVPVISCSSAVPVKNMLVHSQDNSLYSSYVQENASPMGVCHPQMPKENNSVMKDSCNSFTKCQILENTNSSSVHGSTDNTMLNMNATKTENVFDIKNQVIATANTLLVSNEHTTMCSSNVTPMYSFTSENVITDATHSSPVGCISSTSSLQLGNNELSNPIDKMQATIAGKDYNITLAQDSILSSSTESVVPKPFTTCLSIDTRVMESGLSQDLHNPMVSNSLCSLPSTIDSLLGSSNHLTGLSNGPHNTSGCSSSSIDNGQSVGNIPTSLSMSDMLIHTAVTLNDSHISNHCPSSITMKDLILNTGMVVNEKTVSNGCMPVDSSLTIDSSPVLHAYSKMCSEPTPQGVVKDMMLGAAMSSTGHDQLISQPQAVTPETVRLDALVNSTLDSHIQSIQTTAGSNQHSKLEVTDAGAGRGCTNCVNSTPSTSTMLDNMFSLNNGAKNSHIECFVAATIHSDISRGVQHPVTNSSQCSQLMSSTEMSTRSNSGGFPSEQTTADGIVTFTVMPTSQFGTAPGISFTSTPGSLQFTNVSTNPTVLSHLMDLQVHQAKVEEKAKLKDGLVVRERREEGMLSQELTQMSDHDLISYINPSCFDQV